MLCALICTALAAVYAETITIDYGTVTGGGSPLVFGGTQPRNLTDQQWDILKEDGFTFMRSQANLAALVPAESPEAYNANTDGCANPANWDWTNGIYGGDFVQRAIDRDMKVCLVIKNALWNRYEGAPVDEETMPRDLAVHGDIIKKIINHYAGGVTFIENFNEVDKSEQFITDGSSYSREEGYRSVVLTAIEAAAESDHPETIVCACAARGLGINQIHWLMESEAIREGLGAWSFHDFDRPTYPRQGVQEIRDALDGYNVDIPVLRSSYVPEWKGDRKDRNFPGTSMPEWVAQHLIGGLRDGLLACGLWEIQPREGEDDPRYWFTGETSTTETAHLWEMMANTFEMGKGENQIVAATGGEYSLTLGAINHQGDYIVVLAATDDGYQADCTLENLPFEGEVEIEVYRGDASDEGKTPIETMNKPVTDGSISFSRDIPNNSVFGFMIGAPASESKTQIDGAKPAKWSVQRTGSGFVIAGPAPKTASPAMLHNALGSVIARLAPIHENGKTVYAVSANLLRAKGFYWVRIPTVRGYRTVPVRAFE